MLVRGRRILGQMWSVFDKPASPSKKKSTKFLTLGKIEETDLLGVSLHKEATHGTRKTLEKILYTTIYVDYPNDLGQTPLFCACARDNEATAILLLQWRANPNEKCLDGMTPCHASSYTGNIYLLGKLIEAGGDLRLHDNNGHSMRDWALRNPDLRKRSKMLQFIDKTLMHAVACNGEVFSQAQVLEPGSRSHKQTSVMEILKLKTGSDISFETLKHINSTGFGKVYMGNHYNGGFISVVPLISETALLAMDQEKYDTGFHSCMERMQWLNQVVSVKQAKPDVATEDGIDLLIADAEYLGKLRHPNIVLLMGVCQSICLDRIMLVFEFVENGTLHHFLHQTTNSLSPKDRVRIMHQTCAAMDFIHCQRLIHCGLSSLAVYLVSSQITKVGNFEFMIESIQADLGKPSPVSLVSHGDFLYNWMSPELIQGLAPHYSSDVYSFCCIAWELFTREIPWKNLKPQSIRKKVIEERTRLNISVAEMPMKMKAIISYGLELKEERRLNKFSFIIDWLRHDQLPNFNRSPTSKHFQNKSDNFADHLLSSTSSLSSKQNEVNAWVQDSLDFSAVNQETEDVCASASQSVSSDEVNEELPVCDNYESPKSQCSIQKPCGNIVTSASVHRDISKVSLGDRQCVSDSDLDQHEAPVLLKPIKPASHSQGFNLGSQPRNSSSHFQSYNPSRCAWTAVLRGDNTWHSQHSQKRPGSGENVKKLADLYQVRLMQHKLRQAILKGSLVPRGSCPELETSSDSTGRGCERKTEQKVDGVHADGKELFMKRTSVDIDAHSSAAADACRELHQKSSTRKKTLAPADRTRPQLGSENNDSEFHQIFYTWKATRDVEISCERDSEDKGDYKTFPKSQQRKGVSLRNDQCMIANNEKFRSQQQLPCQWVEDEIDGSSPCHQLLAQEIKAAHQRLMKKSLGTGNKLSPMGPDKKLSSGEAGKMFSSMGTGKTLLSNVDYHSSSLETEVQHNRPLSECQLVDKHSIQKQAPLLPVALKLQLGDNALLRKVRIQDLCQVPDGGIGHGGNRQQVITHVCQVPDGGIGHGGNRQQFITHVCQVPDGGIAHDDTVLCTGDLDASTPLSNDSQTKTHILNVNFDPSSQVNSEKNILGAKVTDSSLNQRHSLTDKASGWNNGSVDIMHETSDCSIKAYHHSTSETAEVVKAVSTCHEEKQIAVGAVGRRHTGCRERVAVNDTVETSCQPDTSAGCTQNTSVDSSRVGRWVDTELAKVKEKVSLRVIRQDKGTESSDSLHALRDISLATTLVEDGDITGDFSTAISSATAVEDDVEELKADISSDFEFQEFYIDDDFDSTQYNQQDGSWPEVCTPHTETEHLIGDSAVITSAVGNVKKKTEFFLCALGNAKPPIFPKKSKTASDLFKKNLASVNVSEGHAKAERLDKAFPENIGDNFGEKTGSCTLDIGSPFLSELTSGLGKETAIAGSGLCVQAEVEQIMSGDGLLSEIYSSRQLTKSQRNKSCLNKENSLHQVKEDSNISKVVEERVTSNEENFKNKSYRKSSSEYLHPLGLVDMPCRVRNAEQDCGRDREISGIDCIKDSPQTGIAGKYKNRTTVGSDSDSDLWVKDRLVTIQKKIKRRRARVAYSVSSDESSDHEQLHLDHHLSADVTYTVNEEEITQKVSNVTLACQDEKKMQVGSSKKRNNHSQNSGSAVEQGMIESAADIGSWHKSQRNESISLAESCIQKKKLTSRKHFLSLKPTNSTPKQRSDVTSPDCCHTSPEDSTLKKHCPEKPRQGSKPSSISTSMDRKKGSSKTSAVISVDCTDSSKVKHESVKQSPVSVKKWQLWKLSKKGENLTPVHARKTLPDPSCSKKSRHSILRKPRISSKNEATPSTGSVTPSAVPMSRSKYSVGHDSKMSSKAISFQDVEDNKHDISSFVKVPVPSKQSREINERSWQGKRCVDSSGCEEIVKTWLERENFADRWSLNSSRQVDHQSIASRVIEVPSQSSRQGDHQSIASRAMEEPSLSSRQGDLKSITSRAMERPSLSSEQTVVPQEESEPTSSLNAVDALLKQSNSLLTTKQSNSLLNAKQSTSHTHDTGSGQRYASNYVKERMSPSWVDCTPIIQESAKKNRMVGLSCLQARSSKHWSELNCGGQRSCVNPDEGQLHTLPDSTNDDHCVTVDLSSFGDENDAGCAPSLKNSKKPAHIGIHRFYIPRERCRGGCTAKLDVSIATTDPAVQRITSTTIDTVSGLTEILLDQTIYTHKLRSTLHLE